MDIVNSCFIMNGMKATLKNKKNKLVYKQFSLHKFNKELQRNSK